MKIYKILVPLVVVVSFASCSEDFLEEKPIDNVELPTAITNEKTLKIGVNGLYQLMQTQNITLNGATTLQNGFGALIPTLNELLADDAFVSESNSNRFVATSDISLSFYAETNADIASLWNSLYRIVNNANYIISFEGQIVDDTTTGEKPEEYFAQAHAIRAMAYYQLVTFFCENYGEGNQDVGIPMPLKFDVSQKLPRSTVSEVYKQIEKDLKDAEVLFTGYNANNKKINKTSVELMLSRYYLAVKDYPNAQLYAQKVLSNSQFVLLPMSDVATFFESEAGELNKEIIFQINYDGKDSPASNDGIIATWNSDPITGRYRQNYATVNFYSRFGVNDARKGTWYTDNFTYVIPDKAQAVDVKKFTTALRDVIVFRKTEAVFNEIEALYHTNQALALSKLVAWVSTYRDPSYSFSSTGPALLKEILDQKNLEFFLEGFRRSDLKRNGIGFQNPKTGVTLDTSKFQFKAFPTPRNEVNTNPNIQQFPGY